MRGNHLVQKLPIILLAMLLAGCTKKASDEIDFGTINNSVYHNNFFGLNVPLPKEWSLQDQTEQRRLMKAGAKLVSGDDKNMEAMVKASELQSVNLFAIFEHPVGSPVPYNPSVISIAESVQHAPGIKSGRDYHYQAKKVLEGGQLEVSFPKDIYTQQLGGVDFDVMETQIKARGLVIRQKYYATIIKGYALCMVTSFTSDEEDASLQKILTGLSFDQNGASKIPAKPAE